jgi:hypothetical protein
MFRSVLVIYLTIMTLAGPLPCCCWAAQLTMSQKSGAVAARASTDDEVPACCRHRHATGKGQPTSERRKHDGRECPCSKDPNRTAAPPNAESIRQFGQVVAAPNPLECPSLAHFLVSITPVDSMVPAVGERLKSQFWSARDLVRAMHFLRC